MLFYRQRRVVQFRLKVLECVHIKEKIDDLMEVTTTGIPPRSAVCKDCLRKFPQFKQVFV